MVAEEQDAKDTSAERASIRARLDDLGTSSAEVAEAYANGQIELPQLVAINEKHKTTRAELESRLEELLTAELSHAPATVSFGSAGEVAEVALSETPKHLAYLEGLTIDQQRSAIDAAMDAIQIMHRGKGSSKPPVIRVHPRHMRAGVWKWPKIPVDLVGKDQPRRAARRATSETPAG